MCINGSCIQFTTGKEYYTGKQIGFLIFPKTFISHLDLILENCKTNMKVEPFDFT
jgi:hypothetical protein